ncbi:hypothetical protein D3C85_1709760 [compost metagenome]
MCSVWCWAGEGLELTINGRTAVNSAGATAATYAYKDGAQAWSVGATSAIANANVPVTVTLPTEGETEGLHYITTYLSVDGGTSNCALTQFIKARPSLG